MAADDGNDSDTKVLPMFREKLRAEDLRKSAPPPEPPAPLPTPSEIADDHFALADDLTEYIGPYLSQNDGSPPAKKSDPLPRPGDAYRPHARLFSQLTSQPLLIHFVRADLSCEGFRYTDLRRLRWETASQPGQGPALLLRFVEAEVTDVRVEGRHLEDVHHWIGEGSMPWLWEQPPGFNIKDDSATVITRITISPAKKRKSGDE